jgi:hypothetical protein
LERYPPPEQKQLGWGTLDRRQLNLPADDN